MEKNTCHGARPFNSSKAPI
ncbi:hypothetical protein Gotri_023204 [Gossypium trilobum]|uniref:Uncharacterized protein n=1 Tax=Gossypium trilobum TaxID=34281 RepID=A0A7J9DI84_9ROSI|nr:hypothetical protein [Gossypium trilobum]